MRKRDEILLFAAIRYTYTQCAQYNLRRPFATEVAELLGMHPKRAIALLYKWDNNGWWEWGVSVRSGWFTDGAPEFLTP